MDRNILRFNKFHHYTITPYYYSNIHREILFHAFYYFKFNLKYERLFPRSIFDRIHIHPVPHPTPGQSRHASVCASVYRSRARGVFTPPRVIPPNSVIQGRE